MSASFSRLLPFSLRFSSSSRTGMDGVFATTWKSLSRRSLLLSSLQFSSFSRTPSPYAVRTSHFSCSCNYSSRAFPRVVGKDNVRVSVWWNSDICPLPARVDVAYVSPLLTAFVRTYGINVGHVQAYAFGDIVRISRENGDDLRCPWMNFVDVPEVRRQPNRTEKIILWEVVKWVEKNPPPACLFFTPTDPYLHILFQELRIRGYDVLLASEEISDDSSDSCNDRREMTMEDLPKFALEKIQLVRDDSSASSDVYSEVPTVDLLSDSDCAPKSVLKQIQHILKSHPDGILLESLRRELVKKDDWIFNQRYYDTWLFSRLILSFPEILQMESRADGTVVTRV